ncbi:uncharacterized protein B0I36DRAFT_346377 [Microdochium trichocladiopsis]|uniref:Uncharacterized protein n=1 Tax=Microdochium trichocladiopsis TaxID=1682393 RepID=A0A9P9BSZ3_9PEZI|nr:uncharacterized protein B0I36DRAFT_346377 [Microdochium trichocladiopsis]KAH7038395.1 hypothetical protein B0I36DRAFT_346377 [Microdochium trichocladiopsis]
MSKLDSLVIPNYFAQRNQGKTSLLRGPLPKVLPAFDLSAANELYKQTHRADAFQDAEASYIIPEQAEQTLRRRFFPEPQGYFELSADACEDGACELDSGG